MADLVKDDESEFWLFGYGSLIWKPPPHFDRQVPGYITGYVRRFWQARYINVCHSLHVHDSSNHLYGEDHRGTPKNPGRVATLIERSYWDALDETQSIRDDKVWGVAYRIMEPRVTEVREYLDIREINGYSIHQTLFYPKEGEKSIQVFVYIGTPSNPQFTGPQQPDLLAEIIHRSIGPSGCNKEYLLCLEEALDRLNPPISRDSHVTQLAKLIRKLENRENSAN